MDYEIPQHYAVVQRWMDEVLVCGERIEIEHNMMFEKYLSLGRANELRDEVALLQPELEAVVIAYYD